MTKATISEPRRKLLRLMQALNFGRICGLAVSGGEPDFNQGVKAVQTIKISGDNSPRPEFTVPDFELKAEVRELFAHLTRLGNGYVRAIEVKHGLPFIIEIEADYTA
jgi:hypothetical protein